MAATTCSDESSIHDVFPRVFQLMATTAIGRGFGRQISRCEMLSEMGAMIKGNGSCTNRGVVLKFGMAVLEVSKLDLVASVTL